MSGDTEKYLFDYPVKVEIVEDKLVISEDGTREGLSFELSKITDCSPISKNDNKIAFSQEYVLAMLYDGEQVVTFYFD